MGDEGRFAGNMPGESKAQAQTWVPENRHIPLTPDQKLKLEKSRKLIDALYKAWQASALRVWYAEKYMDIKLVKIKSAPTFMKRKGLYHATEDRVLTDEELEVIARKFVG